MDAPLVDPLPVLTLPTKVIAKVGTCNNTRDLRGSEMGQNTQTGPYDLVGEPLVNPSSELMPTIEIEAKDRVDATDFKHMRGS